MHKLDEIIDMANSLEKTQNSTGKFFNKLSNFLKGNDWNTVGEWAEKIKGELIKKTNSYLSDKELVELLEKREMLQDYERQGLHSMGIKISRYFKEQGSSDPSDRIHLENLASALWKGVFQIGDYEFKSRSEGKEEDNFTCTKIACDKVNHFLSLVFVTFKEDKETMSHLLKTTFQNADAKEIDRFFELFNHWGGKGSARGNVLSLILRSIPHKNYFEETLAEIDTTLASHKSNKLYSHTDSDSMVGVAGSRTQIQAFLLEKSALKNHLVGAALLSFVDSVRKNDLDGVFKAMMILQARDKGNLLKAEVNSSTLARELLSSEELEIFRSNYSGYVHTASEPEEKITKMDMEPNAEAVNEVVEESKNKK